MKTLAIFLLCSIGFYGNTQTNVISLKSHSGSIENLSHEVDNFGLPSKIIDSFIYIGQCCVIEVSHRWEGEMPMRLKVCDHYVFIQNDFNVSKLKKIYPENVVFVGFEKYRAEKKKQKRKKNSGSSGVRWLNIGLMGLLLLGVARAPKRVLS